MKLLRLADIPGAEPLLRRRGHRLPQTLQALACRDALLRKARCRSFPTEARTPPPPRFMPHCLGTPQAHGGANASKRRVRHAMLEGSRRFAGPSSSCTTARRAGPRSAPRWLFVGNARETMRLVANRESKDQWHRYLNQPPPSLPPRARCQGFSMSSATLPKHRPPAAAKLRDLQQRRDDVPNTLLPLLDQQRERRSAKAATEARLRQLTGPRGAGGFDLDDGAPQVVAERKRLRQHRRRNCAAR